MQSIDYQALYARLVGAMEACAPPGWEHLELSACFVGTTAQQELYAVAADGTRTWCQAPGFTSYVSLSELRAALAEPATGAWWSAVVTFTDQGRFSTTFNYDDEPEWGYPLPDQAYVADLARFPRTPENTPPWLAERVRRAGVQQ